MATIQLGDVIVFYEKSLFDVYTVNEGPAPRENREPIIHFREMDSVRYWWKPWTWGGGMVSVRKQEEFEAMTGAKLDYADIIARSKQGLIEKMGPK